MNQGGQPPRGAARGGAGGRPARAALRAVRRLRPRGQRLRLPAARGGDDLLRRRTAHRLRRVNREVNERERSK